MVLQIADWILTSPQGKEEAARPTTTAYAYDAQMIAFALYTGNMKVAQEVINDFPQKRIFPQIAPDGRQPHELQRTLAFDYSQYNLTHFIDIMLMAKNLGIKLDDITSTDGRNFYRAMDFLASYVGKGLSEWPYQQISDWDSKQNFCKDLYRCRLPQSCTQRLSESLLCPPYPKIA